MANKSLVKRGLEANRSGITPDEGELIYTTDDKRLHIGDGSTVGGNPVGPKVFVQATEPTEWNIGDVWIKT